MEGGTQTAVWPGSEAHWPLSVQAPPGRTVLGRDWESGPGAKVSVPLAAASEGRGGSRPPSADVTGGPATSGGRGVTSASADPATTPESVSRESGASGCPGRIAPASRPGPGAIAASPGTAPRSCPASITAPPSRPLPSGAVSRLGPSTARAASPPDCAPPPEAGSPAGADRSFRGSRLQPRSAILRTMTVFAMRIMIHPRHSKPVFWKEPLPGGLPTSACSRFARPGRWSRTERPPDKFCSAATLQTCSRRPQ